MQVLVRQAEKQAARLAKDMAEQLAAEADRRRIDDRHHLFDVAGQQRIEQRLVGILQTAQEHVISGYRCRARGRHRAGA